MKTMMVRRALRAVRRATAVQTPSINVQPARPTALPSTKRVHGTITTTLKRRLSVSSSFSRANQVTFLSRTVVVKPKAKFPPLSKTNHLSLWELAHDDVYNRFDGMFIKSLTLSHIIDITRETVDYGRFCCRTNIHSVGCSLWR